MPDKNFLDFVFNRSNEEAVKKAQQQYRQEAYARQQALEDEKSLGIPYERAFAIERLKEMLDRRRGEYGYGAPVDFGISKDKETGEWNEPTFSWQSPTYTEYSPSMIPQYLENLQPQRGRTPAPMSDEDSAVLQELITKVSKRRSLL